MRRTALILALCFASTASAGGPWMEGSGSAWVLLDVRTSEPLSIIGAGIVFSGPADLLGVEWNESAVYTGGEEGGSGFEVRFDARSSVADGSYVLVEGMSGTADRGLVLPDAGRHRVLFIFGGDVDRWVIERPPEAERFDVLAIGVPRTISIEDWGGLAHSRVVFGSPSIEAGVASSVSFNVDETLTGWFFQGGLVAPGAGSMTLSLPDGQDLDCLPFPVSPCHFPNPLYRHGGPPGTYTAKLTGAIASESNTPGFVVADVPLWDFP